MEHSLFAPLQVVEYGGDEREIASFRSYILPTVHIEKKGKRKAQCCSAINNRARRIFSPGSSFRTVRTALSHNESPFHIGSTTPLVKLLEIRSLGDPSVTW